MKKSHSKDYENRKRKRLTEKILFFDMKRMRRYEREERLCKGESRINENTKGNIKKEREKITRKGEILMENEGEMIREE